MAISRRSTGLKRNALTAVRSWEFMPAARLRPSGTISAAFLERSVADYRGAARIVRGLPYGRNANPDETLAVLRERRGTCSTKHALLARLAIEQELPIELILGIYAMDDRNTPGVDSVLRRYNVASIPEAHCYLKYRAERVDLTREVAAAKPLTELLFEQTISPDQVGAYKLALHQRFMREWIAVHYPARSFEEIWRAREECIAALSQ